VPCASCGGATDCRREEAEGRWPGGGVRRGLQAVAGRRCVSALGRQGQGGRRLLEGGVRQLQEGGVRCREGRQWRAGVGDWGDREEWGDAVRVSQ
jgi:hypothetical protein